MPIRLSPIMMGLLAASLPSVASIAWAADLGQIIVDDPTGSTHRTLDPGDTVTFAGYGAAIDVSVAGNSLTADQITINTSNQGIGARAKMGGKISLANSTIKTAGSNQGMQGLLATGTGSLITATNTDISTQGAYSHGVLVQDGGRIELNGGHITTADYQSSAIRVEDTNSNVIAKNLDITTTSYSAHGLYITNSGKATLENVNIKVSGNDTHAILVYGANALLSLRDTHIAAQNGFGVNLESGTLDMDGGSITSSGTALYLGSLFGSPGASATLKNTKLVANGRFLYGIDINADNASATLENVSISAFGTLEGTGVWLPSVGTSLKAKNFEINASHMGIDNRAGHVTLEDGKITTQATNGYGLYVSREYGSSATIKTKNVQIETFGNSAVGALTRISGAEIHLEDSSVITHGDGAYGLFASGTNSKLTTRNTSVTTSGDGASGLSMSNRTIINLDNTKIDVSGADARGIWSYVTVADFTNAFSLTNGSSINTQDGAGLLLTAGNHAITLDNASITARTGGVEDDGILLHTRALTVTSGGVSTVLETGQVDLDATKATLTGDVLMDSGVIDISLKDHSTLTGALQERGTGRVNSLSLDQSSTWNVRGDSTLDSLNNTGVIAFVSPGASGNFKTLTVKNYVGGGTLVMNTKLGDDNSPTDKLIIDGGTTSGNTALRVRNAGGSGGQTLEGIRLVETINGGTTTTDAFHLDSGSTGYRASTTTVALNGYDYSLIRGGNGGVEDDWYLTSKYTPPVDPDPPVDPEPPVDPDPPVKPPIKPDPPIKPPVIPPVGPGPKNVSPESGAYIGNQLAATRLFMHSLHDRSSVSSDSVDLSDGRRMWARAQARHDSGLRMAEGNVRIKTDSTMLQLGGDLLRRSVSTDGALYVGVMAGYGDTQTHSTSTMRAPKTGKTSRVRAKGKVSGYSVGMYGTIYQNDSTRLGAYGDVWLQYGRYSNRLNSELGSASYHSNIWTASVESGYAFQPFSADSALGNMVVEPHAQVTYSNYDANDVTLQGTRMRSGNNDNWNTRVGVRLYPHAKPDASHATLLPFIEANWLYSGDTASVRMGNNTLDAQPSRNALELKLGVQGQLSQRVDISGHLFGQTGSHSQRGYGGMLKVGYRW